MIPPAPAETSCPLDRMAARRAGRTFLKREELDDYILAGLRGKIASARQNSPFYKKRLPSLSGEFPRTPEEYASLPLTSPEDLSADPLSFLAVTRDEISRIVTLPTSGSTGRAKRLFFTEVDLERIMEIFREGMTLLAAPGDRVLVLLPGERPGSIGDLLHRGLAKGGMECEWLWPPPDEEIILKRMADARTACIVSLPALALSLARHPASSQACGLKGVLLSGDFAAESLCAGIARSWKCRVLRHYALTELGYGGALECPAGQGFHVMEGDFYFEIVDSEGKPLPEGVSGEIIVTPFTLEGTSLFRYRTGDRGRFLEGRCPCGSVLRRIETTGRLRNAIALPDGPLPLARLDEALFTLPWLGDYSVAEDRERLFFSLYAPGRKFAGQKPVPEEFSDLAGILKTLITEFPSLAVKRNTFTFISRSELRPSSRKRMVSLV